MGVSGQLQLQKPFPVGFLSKNQFCGCNLGSSLLVLFLRWKFWKCALNQGLFTYNCESSCSSFFFFFSSPTKGWRRKEKYVNPFSFQIFPSFTLCHSSCFLLFGCFGYLVVVFVFFSVLCMCGLVLKGVNLWKGSSTSEVSESLQFKCVNV